MVTQLEELTSKEMQNTTGRSSLLEYIAKEIVEAVAGYIDGLGRPTV